MNAKKSTLQLELLKELLEGKIFTKEPRWK
jgi:hypothetical protein